MVPRDPEKPIDGEARDFHDQKPAQELPTTAKLRSEVEKFIEELASGTVLSLYDLLDPRRGPAGHLRAFKSSIYGPMEGLEATCQWCLEG